MPEGSRHRVQPALPAASPGHAPAPLHGEVRAHGSPQWFIYYRVATGDLAAVQDCVRHFQQSLQKQWPGLACGLMRRPGDTDGLVTLMETYAPTHPASGAASLDLLPSRLEQGPPALAAWVKGGRHAETFVPCV